MQYVDKLMTILILSLLLVMNSTDCSAGKDNWSELAQRLSGESEPARTKVVQSLWKIPSLEANLRRELVSEKRFLAVDVISALKLNSLLPDLLALSEEDETGFFYNAINSMITEKNRSEIMGIYRQRVIREETPPAAKVVLLDTLGRLFIPLEVSDLKQLLVDISPDVRSAALYYLRSFILNTKNQDFLPLLSSVLSSEPFQLRVQAIHFLMEIDASLSSRFRSSVKDCLKDANLEVRKACSLLEVKMQRRGTVL